VDAMGVPGKAADAAYITQYQNASNYPDPATIANLSSLFYHLSTSVPQSGLTCKVDGVVTPCKDVGKWGEIKSVTVHPGRTGPLNVSELGFLGSWRRVQSSNGVRFIEGEELDKNGKVVPGTSFTITSAVATIGEDDVWWDYVGGSSIGIQADMSDSVKVPAIANKIWRTCDSNFYPGDTFPGGKPRPSQMNVEYALAASGNDPEMTAFVMAMWSHESSFAFSPQGDHGPMQLTRPGLAYYPKVKIEEGAFDPFSRPGEGKGKIRRTWNFTGSPLANIQTAVNLFRWRQDNEKSSFYDIAYGYGPGYLGDEKDPKKKRALNHQSRDDYAKARLRHFEMYRTLVTCITASNKYRSLDKKMGKGRR
jgi:hypothetical protein